MTDLDTGTDELLARVQDGVAVLTLNRPERRNALTEAMLTALAMTLRAGEGDGGVARVGLPGAAGALCAGGDVKAMAEGDGRARPFDEHVQRQRISHRETSGRLHRMPKPPSAAIPGGAAAA